MFIQKGNANKKIKQVSNLFVNLDWHVGSYQVGFDAGR